MPRPWRLPVSVLMLLCVVYMFGLVRLARAQNRTQATTDPAEARALNSIFAKWQIQAPQDQWNVSGELCSGFAIDNSITVDEPSYNPFIKCDCSFNSSTICRITGVKVYARDVQGPIPDELWTLTRLTNLDLRQNLLSGSLSPSIGNLTRMQWLTFGINALSGPVPTEIGLLTDLRLLGIGSNNFSGSLPAELGNCLKLQQLYIDSSGVSGEIPATYAGLREMVTVWASDIEVTGGIPDFIGNWTKLETLRIFGTGLVGPIPSSFAKLVSLKELRIGDLSNRSSSLAFIKDMQNLTVLVLRNINISDVVPSNIGEYQSLQQLDLSFNNITGPIPGSLFNLSTLTHLFLGNNRLNGSLPAQKSPSLQTIDVSYNNLVGGFPSWVSQPNLQLNFVANNLTVGDSNSGTLPGLNCLQRNFPCNQGTGIYFNFSVNCGGPQIRSASGIVYEKGNETLGPSSYFVSGTQRWAVSNVGLFTGSNSNQHIASSTSQFATLDSELFQTARLSASSLRYYGLGLENGNYTVNLQFSELQIRGGSTWESLGRRVFDIFVQGNLELKDFDIRRAGGAPLQVVQRQFKAQVTQNVLEVHLFWAGKGTCCIPAQGTYGPIISAISATPDFTPTVANKAPSKEESKTGIIVGVVVGVGVASILAVALFCIVQRRRKRQAEDEEVLLGIDTKPYTFSYAEIRSATQDFDPTNKLGEGGYGPVYKGKLNDGREIAVKQLSVASRQGKGEFIAEIATISAVQHRNLVKLYGCCLEGVRRLLVYEYLPNKSLDQALFEQKNLRLDWSTRYEICLGVARGLAYLHEESRLRIVHRDVKASNILLDSDLVPKISDFGLAKLYDDKKTHISTRVAGTIGYLAPEYAMRGHLTEKTDVFAFGVVALEIVSGRPNSDQDLEDERKYLLEWAWNLHENNCEVELVDPNLTKFNEEEVKRVIGVALLCTQTSYALRPPMSRVVAMLSGDVEVSSVTSRPGYLNDLRFDDISSFISTEDETRVTTDSSSHQNLSSAASVAAGTEHSPLKEGR